MIEDASEKKAGTETTATEACTDDSGTATEARDDDADSGTATEARDDDAIDTTSDVSPSRTARGTAPDDELDADAIFEALWSRALDSWEDDKPHAALLEHALKSESLPTLAGRYRALKNDPAKGPRAEKKIDAIVVAATQMLMATKMPAPTKAPWQWSATAALMFALVCAFLFYQLFIPHR